MMSIRLLTSTVVKTNPLISTCRICGYRTLSSSSQPQAQNRSPSQPPVTRRLPSAATKQFSPTPTSKSVLEAAKRCLGVHGSSDADAENLVGVSNKKTRKFFKIPVPSSQDLKILRALASYVWPKDDSKIRKRVVLALALLFAGKIANVQVPYVFKKIVDSLGDASTMTPLQVASASPTISLLSMAGMVMLGYGGARVSAAVFQELRNAIFSSVAQSAVRRVARNIFSHLLNLDLRFHLTRQTGGLSRAIDRGTKGISFLLSAMVFHVVPTAFELGIVMAIMGMKYGSSYAYLTLGTMTAYVTFTVATTAWRTKFRRNMNRADNQGATRIVDALINFETVKQCQGEAREIAKYDTSLKQYEDAAIKTQTSLSLLNGGQGIIFSGALTWAMWMASKGVLAGDLTVGDLVMINGLLFQLSFPLNFLGTVYRELRQALIDMDVMFRLEQIKSEVMDKPDAIAYRYEGGAIKFDNVSFGYALAPRASEKALQDRLDGKEEQLNGEETTLIGQPPMRTVLKNVSFDIAPGKHIGIVGPTGCGKSTVLKMIFRFFDPSTGGVFIDGQNIKDLEMASFRKYMSVVPQDIPLFNGTVYENIQYGAPDATPQEVYEAAMETQIHDSVQRFADGYESKVGERGLILSGGEKQRIALARALLRNPKILLMDEGTSSLDSATEKKVMQRIKGRSRRDGLTCVFVAHRLTTVMDCNEILVFSHGGLLERGSHDYLMNQSEPGLYRSMWKSQEQERQVEPGETKDEIKSDQ